jgi:hypothetical protein
VKRFLVVIPVFLFIFLGACGVPGNQIDPRAITLVVQTLTATMWTPTPVTPSPTSVPKEVVVVNTLNGVLRGADPLGEAIDAKFYIIDVGFEASGNPPVLLTMRVHVECEWILKPSCTAERAFVVLMHAFERDGVRNKIIEQIPATIEWVQVMVFDHLSHIGTIAVRWQDIVAFASKDISGDQLAARVNRSNP